VPMFIVPRHKRETFRPDWPRRMYSIVRVSFLIASSYVRGCVGPMAREPRYG
jgi:hypothetical protein